MERHAGFVRAVMVGRDGLDRSVLLECFRAAGADRPRSYLATGNVTFSVEAKAVDAVRQSVEHNIEDVVGRRTEVAIRSIAHLQRLIDRDPFAEYPDAVEHEVSFLTAHFEPSSIDLPYESSGGYVTLIDATPSEVFAVGREVEGRRKGAGGIIERLLGQRVTTRVWRTLVRVATDPDPRTD